MMECSHGRLKGFPELGLAAAPMHDGSPMMAQ
jgi:hypothetical protein